MYKYFLSIKLNWFKIKKMKVTHIIIALFSLTLIFSCGSDSSKGKLKLNENITYKEFVGDSLLSNEAVASFFEEITTAFDNVIEKGFEIISKVEIDEYRLTQTETENLKSSFGNLLSSGLNLVDLTSSGIGMEKAYFSVLEQMTILQGFKKSFNNEINKEINTKFKDYVTTVYPLKYRFTNNNSFSLDLDKKTIKTFKSNPKLDDYYTEKLVPSYYKLIQSYIKLHKIVALNQLNNNQIDSLKLQLSSSEKNYGVFKNTSSIKEFKRNYLNFSEIIDIENSDVSSEIKFLNDKSLKIIKEYTIKLDSKIEKMIANLGTKNQKKFKEIMFSNIKNVNRKDLEKILKSI